MRAKYRSQTPGSLAMLERQQKNCRIGTTTVSKGALTIIPLP